MTRVGTNILFHFWRNDPCRSRIFFRDPTSLAQNLFNENDFSASVNLLVLLEPLSNPLWNLSTTKYNVDISVAGCAPS